MLLAVRAFHIEVETRRDVFLAGESFRVEVTTRDAQGGLGTFCIYQASSEEKIREHAARAGIPATDIFEVADTVIVRPDPAVVTA